ncbi:hypothetical protein ACFXKR_12945 [Streptomyces violascens]
MAAAPTDRRPGTGVVIAPDGHIAAVRPAAEYAAIETHLGAVAAP